MLQTKLLIYSPRYIFDTIHTFPIKIQILRMKSNQIKDFMCFLTIFITKLMNFTGLINDVLNMIFSVVYRFDTYSISVFMKIDIATHQLTMVYYNTAVATDIHSLVRNQFFGIIVLLLLLHLYPPPIFHYKSYKSSHPSPFIRCEFLNYNNSFYILLVKIFFYTLSKQTSEKICPSRHSCGGLHLASYTATQL